MSTPAFPTLRSARLTSPFGWRTHPITGELSFHHGIDLAPEVPGTTGVPVYATQDGIVRRRDWGTNSGNFLEIEHTSDGYSSTYLHLASFNVSQGQTVRKGQTIGIMGTTGRSSGIHLDFGITTSYPPLWRSPGNFIDPLGYLEGAVDGGSPITPISGNRYLTREEMRNNAEYILSWFLERGWTKNAVAGMLGNMETESTINPGIWQNLDEGNTSLGVGLVQWTPATKLIDWADAQGSTWSDMDVQLERIVWEVENNVQWIATSDYPLSFSEFRVSELDPHYLGMAFLRNYERPADQDQPERGEQAVYWFNSLDGSGIIDPTDPREEYRRVRSEYINTQLRRIQHRRRN